MEIDLGPSAPVLNGRLAASDYLGREVPVTEDLALTLRDVLLAARRDRDDAQAYRGLLADTRHQIRFDRRGWTIKHPMSERIQSDDLFACPATLVASHLPEPEEYGTYYCSVLTDGDTTTLKIEEKISDE